MALITWTEDQFGVGVGFADDQHKVLFGLLNTLHETAAGSDRAQTGKDLDALIGYVVEHFQNEENEMKAKGYSDYESHKAFHDKLVEKCAGVQTQFHAGDEVAMQEVTLLVKDWLDNHIPTQDRAYEPCLNG
ncbi:hypothetical protein MNBD_GAMMA13-1582 [hydrothermal vent metagenome]|uniref:Hemerythrin-like domain-containing protein n=1 Tax=hydrothermal vent metagenome TaxID=652676 RepID=A0A3B0Y7W3_9ZZZZ